MEEFKQKDSTDQMQIEEIEQKYTLIHISEQYGRVQTTRYNRSDAKRRD